jgi:ABC-type Fe3+/spermidine/putrescine transport system ATPase subunit
MGFVFQRYALFPTMTVFENVAFGLEMRRVESAERDHRVFEAIAMTGLSGMEQRKPNQLSGGQQQRVALARALVIRPHILLLDEPLSNLDANLRIEMRTEIRKLQRDIGITTLYVTHDQEEAFALSDRVLVLAEGRTQQIGSPQALYFHPRNNFVAGFIGQTNLFTGKCIQNANGKAVVAFGTGTLEIAVSNPLEPEEVISFSVRPERVKLTASGRNGLLRGSIRQREFRGASMLYHIDCNGTSVLAEIMAFSHRDVGTLFKEGDTVSVLFDGADCAVVGKDGA